jgi:ubiquinone/menaquinone biosynthesis C-methylase UbiE
LEVKEKLNSKVKYKIMDVYEINPKKIGYFDFVFCGTVLIHLTDPIRALRNIRSVIKDGGVFICANPILKKPWICLINIIFHFLKKKLTIAEISVGRTKIGDVPTYWIPTEDCLHEMLYKAGFDNIEKVSNFTLRGYSKAAHREEIHPHVVFRCKV